MSLGGLRFLKTLKPGRAVIVKWLDSGLGDQGQQGGKHSLVFNETHGRVTHVWKDKAIHKAFCKRGDPCECWVLEMAMDSAGPDDTRSDLAIVWVRSIADVKVWTS